MQVIRISASDSAYVRSSNDTNRVRKSRPSPSRTMSQSVSSPHCHWSQRVSFKGALQQILTALETRFVVLVINFEKSANGKFRRIRERNREGGDSIFIHAQGFHIAASRLRDKLRMGETAARYRALESGGVDINKRNDGSDRCCIRSISS